ncbi:MAG: hypothetical protein ABFS86_15075 [Planctomycetota bacterium]
MEKVHPERAILVLAPLLIVLASLAAPAAAAGTPEKMRVLALMDSDAHPWTHDIRDPVHSFVEMPLNYLGIVVDRHDIRTGPPPEGLVENARAVVLLFGATKKPCDWLRPWLTKQAGRPGLRFVHIEDFGPLALGSDGTRDMESLAGWLSRFGLRYDDYHREDTLGIEVEWIDDALCAYEADPRFAATHAGTWSEDDGNRVWVTTRMSRDVDRPRHPVVTGPWGGVAQAPWTIQWGNDQGDRRWHLDPFAFFREALGLERVPAPHPAVLNGRRMFFCHVDGDAFESTSTMDGGALAGKVLLDRVIDEFPLPFTVSVIIASLTKDLDVEEPTDRMLLARDLFSRKNVEPASHAVLHPFVWQKRYAPKGARRLAAFRSILNYDPSPAGEVRESFRFINERLLSEGRYCRVMLWSGDTMPSGATVAEVARLGGWNLNGGTFRWDDANDSVGYVSPWARLVDGSVQVYAGAGNENEYDGFWDSVPTAYGHADTTIARTGRGRILKPANVYLHFYSAERPGRLDAAKRLIRKWGLEQSTAPVFASDYCKAVHAAVTTARLFRTADGWRWAGFGGCRTLRIDGETRSVDFAKSSRVLGAGRRGDSLFIHLGAPDGTIVLADAPAPRPHVLEANHVLFDADLGETRVSLFSEALCPRVIRFAGFPPNSPLVVSVDGRERNTRADAEGKVRFETTKTGRIRVEVRVP